MVETNLDKTLAVLAAIRNQDADAALRYVDPHFIQHFPPIAAGAEGLRDYILHSTRELLNLGVVRALEDGSYVVTQLKAKSSDEDMFAVWRYENGLIAEHWAFTSPGAPPNRSGHTQVDGPVKPRHLGDTERNKAFARHYYETFHLAGKRDQNDTFFSGGRMVRHEPGVRDGLDEFLHDVGILMQHRTIDELNLLIGQGDLVFIAATGTHEGKLCAYIDLYRIDNLKIVEHWGFGEKFPVHGESHNDNSLL